MLLILLTITIMIEDYCLLDDMNYQYLSKSDSFVCLTFVEKHCYSSICYNFMFN